MMGLASILNMLVCRLSGEKTIVLYSFLNRYYMINNQIFILAKDDELID